MKFQTVVTEKAYDKAMYMFRKTVHKRQTYM